MNIIPAIDLKSGQCVRLYQGQYENMTAYNNDPLKVAKEFADAGADYLHIVDLDGAKQGELINLEIMRAICQNTKLKLQVGGGIRTKQQIDLLFEIGVERVVIGSMAITQIHTVKQWLNQYSAEKIVLALDIRINAQAQPQLASHGWQIDSEKNLWQLLEEYQDTHIKHVLCTDIQRDGTLQGPNTDLYKECQKRFPNIQFQASGGIGSLNDLQKLIKIPVSSVIIGKALYENKFSFKDLKKSFIC